VLKVTHILRLLLVLSLVVLVMFWVSISSSLKDRHQHYKNIYRQTYLQKGPIDVIASGSSRAIALAGAVELKSSLEKKYQNENIIVYNYGKAGRDLVIDYVYLKDYLREHCVGTVLVEVNHAHVKDRYHMHFEHIAPYSVIWDSYMNDRYYGWPRRFQLGLRASVNKMLKSVYRRPSSIGRRDIFIKSSKKPKNMGQKLFFITPQRLIVAPYHQNLLIVFNRCLVSPFIS